MKSRTNCFALALLLGLWAVGPGWAETDQPEPSSDGNGVSNRLLDALSSPPAVTNGVGGIIASDASWSAAQGVYLVTNNLTVASNVTLTIGPGVTVLLRQGTRLTVNGRLLAEGTASQRITFTRAPGATTWDRLMFVYAEDSRLRHCLIEYANSAGDHKNYYPTNCYPPIFRPRNNYHEAVVALCCHLDIEGCVFQKLPATGGEGDAIAIISDHPDPTNTNTWNSASATVRNCQFYDIGQGVHTRYAYVLVEGCTFVSHNGDNDDVDLYGESLPVPLVRSNLFLYAHDDFINPTRCSAIISENVFIGTNDTDHIIVLRDVCRPIVMNNLLYRGNAGGISVQNGCEGLIVNNTIVNCPNALKMFDHLDRTNATYCLAPMSGKATLLNNIIWNSSPAFNLNGNAFGTLYAHVSYSDTQGGTNSASIGAKGRLDVGPGNLNLDPLFVSAAATNFHLQPTSPCIDAGTNQTHLGTDLATLVRQDMDRIPRPLDGNGLGGPAYDIGAYEYLLPAADSNGDGIPDGWTWFYGFNPTAPDIATGNPDQDSGNTWQEYVADTNPTNALSYFHIESITGDSTVNLQFLSSSNRQYTLWRTTNLTDHPPGSTWLKVSGPESIPGNGGLKTVQDTNPASPSFYRLEVKAP